MIATSVSYGSRTMCEIPTEVSMGPWMFRPLYHSRDQLVYSELLEESNIDALHSLGDHPSHNQFYQYSLCMVYYLWQPDELHQLLLSSVKTLLHWLLKFPIACNVKQQFDNQFTTIPQYPGLQDCSTPFKSPEKGPGMQARSRVSSKCWLSSTLQL